MSLISPSLSPEIFKKPLGSSAPHSLWYANVARRVWNISRLNILRDEKGMSRWCRELRLTFGRVWQQQCRFKLRVMSVFASPLMLLLLQRELRDATRTRTVARLMQLCGNARCPRTLIIRRLIHTIKYAQYLISAFIYIRRQTQQFSFVRGC